MQLGLLAKVHVELHGIVESQRSIERLAGVLRDRIDTGMLGLSSYYLSSQDSHR